MQEGLGYFWLFGIVAVVLSIVLGTLYHQRNKSMDHANAVYRNAANQATRAIQAANMQLGTLRFWLDCPQAAPQEFDDMCHAVGRFEELYREAETALQNARDEYHAAYEIYVSGVHQQNFLFGGADLSVFSLHKRAKALQKIRVEATLEDPALVLSRYYSMIAAYQAGA